MLFILCGMNKHLVVIVFLLFGLNAFCQSAIGDYKATVRGKMHRVIKLTNCTQCQLTETDSTITVLSKDSNAIAPALFIYHFNNNKKCYAEETIANCKSCFEKYLADALNKKEYEWVKADDKHWVSKYSKKLMLEITDNQKAYSFIVYRIDGTKGLYNQLIKP